MTVLSTMTDDELLVKWANRREEEARALLHRPSGVNASAYLDELRRRLAENTRLRGEVESDTSRHESEIGYWLGSSQERKAKIANLAAENTRLRKELDEEQLLPLLFAEHVDDWLLSNQVGRDAVRWGCFPLGMVGRWIERAESAEQEVARLTEAVRDCADRLANNFDNENIVASVAVDLRAALSEGGES